MPRLEYQNPNQGEVWRGAARNVREMQRFCGAAVGSLTAPPSQAVSHRCDVGLKQYDALLRPTMVREEVLETRRGLTIEYSHSEVVYVLFTFCKRMV